MVDSFYKAVDREELSKLPFIGKPVPFYFNSGRHPLVGGLVYRIERPDFEKAKKRITGENHVVKPGDKVYVMYKNDVPKFKIEEHLKRIGAKLVDDYRKADIILGSKNMIKERRDNLQSATSLLFEPDNLYTISRDILPMTTDDEKFKPVMTDSLKEYDPVLNPPVEGIFETSGWGGVNRSGVAKTEYLGYTGNLYITPLGASLLYWVLKNKVPIVSESAFSSQITGAITLDDHSYQSIVNMLESGNNQDCELAGEMLANCNIEDSIYYIFKIADKFPYKFNTSTNKNIRLFTDNSGYNDISKMNASEFAEYLRKKGKLTQEVLDKLIPQIEKDFKNSIADDVFDIILVPKEEYSEFNIEQRRVILSKQER